MKLKNKIAAFVLTLLMSVSVAVPSAFAADMNKNEEKAYDEFCAVLDRFEARTNFDHAGQYKAEAKKALLDSRIDLDATAVSKFSEVLSKVDSIFEDCNTQAEAWARRDEIVPAVNKVANQYNMTVTVDAKTKDAKVTINGDTIASTSSNSSSGTKIVKQTGFSVGQSLTVAAMAGVSLVIAFAITRRGDRRVAVRNGGDRK